MREELIKKIRGKVQDNGWISGYCPWHEAEGTHTPSLIVREDLTFFKCMSQECAKGPINILLRKLEMDDIVVLEDCIDREKVYNWAIRLQQDKPDLTHLKWDLEYCKILNIGYTGTYFTIPIIKDGVLVQVWKYKPGAEQSRKYKGIVVNAPLALFPDLSLLSAMEGEDIYLCEGFGDTIALLSAGYCAVTGGGKTHWKPEHIDMLLSLYWNKIIRVPDTDKTGKILGRRLGFWLNKKNIKSPWLSFPEEDVTEALKNNNTPDKWTEYKEYIEEGAELEEEPIDIRLSELHLMENNQLVRFKAVVSGKYDSPYRVPAEFSISCEESSEKICSNCIYGNGSKIVLGNKERVGLVGVSLERMDSRLKKVIDRPSRCPGCRIDILNSDLTHLEEIRIRLPHEEISIDESNIDRKCFYNGVGLIVNDTYNFTGYIVSHPETQEVSFIATEAEHLNVEVGTDITCPRLPFSKLDHMIADISYNVSNIYARDELHKFTLATLFSPMSCKFQGISKRIYSETLILGDSECGKSAVMKALFRFYKVGTIVDASQTTAAGILGGISETDRGRRFISPGTLVSYDRKIVGIEEMGNLHGDIIKAMRETRSSGVVSIGKIEKAQYSARTRIIATGNPKSGRRTIRSFNHGIEAVFSVFTDPADIRRFTTIHIIQDDLDPEARYKDLNLQIEHRYTKDIARKHLSWCWSLTEDEVLISKKVEERIIEYAKEIGIKGHTALPLLTKTNAVDKILQLSVSIACMLGSTADGRCVKVMEHHVDEAVALLMREYDSLPSGYFDYCADRHSEDVITIPEEVTAVFTSLTNPRQMAQALKRGAVWNGLFDLQTHCMLGNNSKEKISNFLNVLFRNNCLRKAGKTIFKTPAFQEWLANNIEDLVNLDERVKEVESL